MSNFMICLVIDAAGVLFFILFVLLFRAVMLCKSKNFSSSGIQMKNYSKASFVNVLAKMQ